MREYAASIMLSRYLQRLFTETIRKISVNKLRRKYFYASNIITSFEENAKHVNNFCWTSVPFNRLSAYLGNRKSFYHRATMHTSLDSSVLNL